MKLTARQIVFLQVALASTPAFAGDSSVASMLWLVLFLVIGFFIVIYGQASKIKANGAAANKERNEDEEKEKKRTARIKAATERIQSITSRHIGTLALKWDQTVSQDEYGNYLFDRWNQALDYFVDNVLRKDELISEHLLPAYIVQTRIALGDPSLMEAEVSQHLHQVKKEIVDAVIERGFKFEVQH